MYTQKSYQMIFCSQQHDKYMIYCSNQNTLQIYLMILKIFIVLSVLLTLSSTYQFDESVIVLKQSDYPSVFKDFPYLLVELYAPWCGHCKALAPTYSEVAKDFVAKGSQIRLAKVDTTVQRIWGEKFAVKGFPTIVFIKNGKKIPFNGSRNKQGITSWLNKKILDPIEQISLEQYKSLNRPDVVKIVYHGDLTTDKGKALERMAIADDYNYYYYGKNLGKPQGTVQMFRPFGDPLIKQKVDYKFKGWVSSNDRPVVVPFDERMSSYAFSQGKPVFLFFNGANAQGSVISQSYSEAATKYSALNPGKLKFSEFLKANPDYSEWSDQLKVDTDMFSMMILNKAQMKKYVQKVDWSSFSAQTILEFIKSWENNQIKAYKLDEEVPQKAKSAQGSQL